MEADGRTLKIGLRNTGAAALRDFILELYAPGIENPLPQQIIAELMPEASRDVAAVLPANIDLKSQPLLDNLRTIPQTRMRAVDQPK
jgi:hypothetical protein